MNWLTNMLKSLGRGMGELSPSCREATRLQSEAMDGPLRLRLRIGLRVHLFLCKWCRRYGEQIRFLRKAAHEHPAEMTQPAHRRLPNAARERMKQRLQTEQE